MRSTVREAMDRDYQIIVLDDASADPEPDTHEFLIGTLFPRHTTILDVEGLHALLTTSTSTTDSPAQRN